MADVVIVGQNNTEYRIRAVNDRLQLYELQSDKVILEWDPNVDIATIYKLLFLAIENYNRFDAIYRWTGSEWSDLTDTLQTTKDGYATLIAGTTNYVYFGKSVPFNTIFLRLRTVGSGLSLTLQYYSTNNEWTSVSFTDTTSNLTKYYGTISFTTPYDWKKTSVNNSEYYWVRLGTSSYTSSASAYFASCNGGNTAVISSGKYNRAIVVDQEGRISIGDYPANSTNTGDCVLLIYDNTYFDVNVGIGTTSFGTSADKVIGIKSGTAPTTSPADVVQLWSEDAAGAAGKAVLHMRGEGNTDKLIIPGVRYKTTTGDPTDAYEGMIVINTYDKAVKIYADGSWRTITSWT